MYENKNKTVKNIHYKNTEPQHQLKGEIKNTELYLFIYNL